MKQHLWLTIGATALFCFGAGPKAQSCYQREVSTIPASDSGTPSSLIRRSISCFTSDAILCGFLALYQPPIPAGINV